MSVSVTADAGAPADEIEITPEMIEAGLTAYDAWYASPQGDTGPLSDMVVAIFRAMAMARISL